MITPDMFMACEWYYKLWSYKLHLVQINDSNIVYNTINFLCDCPSLLLQIHQMKLLIIAHI